MRRERMQTTDIGASWTALASGDERKALAASNGQVSR